MKRTSLVAATILLAFTGCNCGQGRSGCRPTNIFSQLHDRFHNSDISNVGAPCGGGGCASAPPAMSAPAMVDAGCETCGSGSQSVGYEGFPSSTSFGGEVVGGTFGGEVIQSSPTYSGEIVPSARAQ